LFGSVVDRIRQYRECFTTRCVRLQADVVRCIGGSSLCRSGNDVSGRALDRINSDVEKNGRKE
jgi:hypothetical protein